MYMCTHGVCKMRNKIYVCVKIIERDYAHLLKARIIGLFDLYLGPQIAQQNIPLFCESQ